MYGAKLIDSPPASDDESIMEEKGVQKAVNKQPRKKRGSIQSRVFEKPKPKRKGLQRQNDLMLEAIEEMPTDSAPVVKRKVPRKKQPSVLERFRKRIGISEDNLANILLTIPPPDKDKPKMVVAKENKVHQADLIYLPWDNGYKYALVVVDPATRLTDAYPLKKHDPPQVVKGFKAIYKRGPLRRPTVMMQTDQGSEFKGEFNKYVTDDLKIVHKYGRAGRSRQQAFAESHNGVISKLISAYETSQEVLTNEVNREWVDILPEIISFMNGYMKRDPPSADDPEFSEPTCKGNTCDMLKEGTKVRVILDKPKNVLGEKQSGKFRVGDARWESEVRTIVQQIVKPGQPPLYLVSGISDTAYTKAQLLVVGEGSAGTVVSQADQGFVQGNKVSVLYPKKRKTPYNGIVVLKKQDGTITIRFAPDSKGVRSIADIKPPYTGVKLLPDSTKLGFGMTLLRERKVINRKVHVKVKYDTIGAAKWEVLSEIKKINPSLVKAWEKDMRNKT